MNNREKNQTDIYEKFQKKYETRKKIGIAAIAVSAVVGILTVIFVFVEVLGNVVPVWNQFHYWSAGLFLLLLVSGITILVFSVRALHDIERVVDRSNPDERERSIREKAIIKTFKIFSLIICPILLAVASVLLLLNIINFVAWIIFISHNLALIVAWAIVRGIEYKKS